MSNKEFKINDSGNRRKFNSGAVRDRAEDKPRPDLISPFALMRIGEWYGKGAKKYSERNWELGMPVSECVASLFRHFLYYMMGYKDEDHLAAIAWNCIAIIHYQELIKLNIMSKDLEDMPEYVNRNDYVTWLRSKIEKENLEKKKEEQNNAKRKAKRPVLHASKCERPV